MQNRINLLAPATEIKTKKKKGPNQFLSYLTVVVITCSLLSYATLYILENRTSRDIAQAKEKLQSMSEVETTSVQKKSLLQEKNSLQSLIKTLNASKYPVSKELDELSDYLNPAVTVTKTEIRFDPPSIVVQGTAPSHYAVAQFQGNLIDSPLLAKAVIKSSMREQNTNVIKFAIFITPERGAK